MTNIKPSQLNYNKYTANKYDRDIINAIPYHRDVHELIVKFIKKKYKKDVQYNILDLGVGTAITTSIIKDILPNSKFDVVDFSRQMINGAKKKLGHTKVKYLVGDYSKIKFDKKYDIIVSVIGLHHQNTAGKKKMFKKIYSLLKPGGVFIFGDLTTYINPYEAARNNALHYHHLVEHAMNKKTLAEWAYHHMFLNDLALIENQIEWLRETGFKVKKDFLQINTALLFCLKD